MTIRARLAVALFATVVMTAGMAAALYHGAASGRAVVAGDDLLHHESRLLRRFEALGGDVSRAAGRGDGARLRDLAAEGRSALRELDDVFAGEAIVLRRVLPAYRPVPAGAIPVLAPWLVEVEAVAGRAAPIAAPDAAGLGRSFERDVRPALVRALARGPEVEAAMQAEANRGTAIGQRIAVWFPMAALAAVAILGVSLFGSLDRRLRRLAAAARRIGAGDLAIALPSRGRDELAAVERAVNAMAADLGRAIVERERLIRERADAEDRVLRTYNARLEAAVQARTGELAAANAELKRRFEELLATRGRLQAADRLATIGQLAAGIGHEINNPLAYVAANLEFVAGELERPPAEWTGPLVAEVRSALQEARDGAARIRAIVRDLETVARTRPGDLGPVDVAGAVKAAVQLSGHELRRSARLEEDCAAGCLVLAEEGRLTQVFLQLLINAVQALPEDRAGENTIRVAVRPEPDGRVVAEVEDNGRGIPAEHLERIFEPFFTTKPVGKGTGLGLSVCQGIVAALGGTIAVDSEVGRGTVFRVVLPGLDAGAPADPTAADGAEVPRRRVLVVEDDPEIGAAALRAVGATADVRIVSGAAEALRVFEQEGPPDVVLCDASLGGTTGLELQGQVARRWPGQERRFVFLIDADAPESVRRSLAATPNPWLEKPFDPARLAALLLAPATA
jgi:signal transduction histidine kinase/CheY-like chemotaxis protein